MLVCRALHCLLPCGEWVTAKLRSLIRLALDGDGSMLDPGDSWICSCVI